MADKFIGKCDKCMQEFRYYIVHNGFNESSYAYCDKCGKTAFFDTYKVPTQLKNIFVASARHRSISKNLEPHICACVCGGSFAHGASPRCPHCKETLSAEAARKYIEANAVGTKKGWKWQGSWTDIYSVVIEDARVNDNWKPCSPELSPKNNTNLVVEKTKKNQFLLVPISVIIGLVVITQIHLTSSLVKNIILIALTISLSSVLFWFFVYSSFGKWLEGWFKKSYDDFINSVEDSKKKHR